MEVGSGRYAGGRVPLISPICSPRAEHTWYTPKRRAHFDSPLGMDAAVALATDPESVAPHAFWPFIGYTEKHRRFRKKKNIATISVKQRPIRYCAHADGHIYRYYNFELSKYYEKFISGRTLSDVVIGYRKGLGSNINLAKHAFDEIRKRRKAIVICLDIVSFFDRIDHAVLKNNIEKILGVDRLPNDWHKIFRSLTRYSWVEVADVEERLRIDLRKHPRRICDPDIFRNIIRRRGDSLVQTNNGGCGIPQGSPLSATLSNVYMLEFDKALSDYCKKYGIYYKRYADDIFLICAPYRKERLLRKVRALLSMLGPTIKFSDDKT